MTASFGLYLAIARTDVTSKESDLKAEIISLSQAVDDLVKSTELYAEGTLQQAIISQTKEIIEEVEILDKNTSDVEKYGKLLPKLQEYGHLLMDIAKEYPELQENPVFKNQQTVFIQVEMRLMVLVAEYNSAVDSANSKPITPNLDKIEYLTD